MDPFSAVVALIAVGMALAFTHAWDRQRLLQALARLGKWGADTLKESTKKAGEEARAQVVKWVGISTIGIVGALMAPQAAEQFASAFRSAERVRATTVPLDSALTILGIDRADVPRPVLPGLVDLGANVTPINVRVLSSDPTGALVQPVFFDGFESGGFGPEVGSGLWLARFCATFESGFLNDADSAHTGNYSLRCIQSGDLGAWLKNTNCGTICTVSAWVMPAEGSNLTTSGGGAQLKHLFGFGTGDSLSWEDDHGGQAGFLFSWERGSGADGYWFIINESTPCADPCAEDAHFQYGTTSSKQGGINDPVEEAVPGYVMDGANGSLTWLGTSHFRTWVHVCLEVRLTTTEAAADGYVGWFRDGQVVASNDNFPIGGINESDEPTGFYIRGAADNITSDPVHYYDDIGVYPGLMCEEIYAAQG